MNFVSFLTRYDPIPTIRRRIFHVDISFSYEEITPVFKSKSFVNIPYCGNSGNEFPK